MVAINRFVLLTSSVAIAAASPILPPAAKLTVRDETSYNASLPNITIFATGGTIAGSAGSADQTTGYQAGALGVEVLINAVPEILNISNVKGVQIANVDSGSITPAILLNLTHQIQEELDSPYCQGVIVTHGTDTLEESAFFLDLTIRSEKPVVFVGAMRPATAISADGPINLLEAVTLAADPAARGRGTMIVLNDRIASAYFTTKTNANSLDTFQAHEQGYLGFFINIEPIFYSTPSTPLGKPYFDVTDTDVLPQVDILYGYQGLNPTLATAAVSSGAEGLVLAGMGAGGWTQPGREVIKQLVEENGTSVVYSRRTMDGYVEPPSTPGYGSGFLNPQKARITLQLALDAKYNPSQMETLFEFASS
ncbi:L-asparaginase [Truncatella angustata]|uniref:asparaginase n=1 Tax=Truncatella angustata TaxID=152316 RepID=A0A9P8UQQ7_9PEZI|nr:L-asparaginase [Truncatella angustata]KAH6656513.1 L-asparaginase [Truncatella angustata]KAH8195154.1 hypothetical protein TruAng_010679 [Truncatella angustata]